VNQNLLESIIKRIKKIIEKTKLIEDKVMRHKHVQNSLLKLFRRKHFFVTKEYRIDYNGKYRIKARFGEPKERRNGLLDVYAKYQNCIIVVEYDNSAMIKWKSVEKLLQSDALLCFGLVYGPKKDESCSRYYIKSLVRIQQVYKELISNYDRNKEFDKLFHLLKMEFWFGFIKLNIFEKVILKDLMKF
jgi:hypothetical protein